MVFKGFKFGMLLQLAVGPICLYIFNQAVEKGILNALIGVLGVVVIDAIFIVLSIIGISTFVEKRAKWFKYFGTVILLYFGIRTIIGGLTMNEITQINIDSGDYLRTFVNSIFLTASNPLTILFWSGVFANKVIEEKLSRTDEIEFGVGAVLSTALFLSSVSFIGQFTKNFISVNLVRLLNIFVGIFLVYYGIKLTFKLPNLFCKNNGSKEQEKA